MKIRGIFAVCLVMMLAVGGYAAEQAKTDAPVAAPKADAVAPATEAKITVSVKDAPIADVLASIASQAKQKILLESNVKGKVSLNVEGITLDAALTAVCKSTNQVWRKVYIDPKSELIEKPDRFAATLRLMAGMSFPDLVVAGASNSKIGVHCQQKQGVEDAQDRIVKDLGMVPIYLVSNDALVAAKEAAKNTAVSKYTQSAKDQLDMFMKMTPEEREQALLDSLNLMESVGSDYYASVMQTLMNSNPDNLRRIMARQTDMLFSMSAEQRRSMMRMNMEAMKFITPEQQKILQEDAMAIMEQMKNQQPAP